MFNLTVKDEPTPYPVYVNKWRKAMQEAYALASKSSQIAASKGKQQNDKRVRSSVLKPGDRVLIRNLTPRGGPGKIRRQTRVRTGKGTHITQKSTAAL